jgi:AcrR family transcriptional regulator
MDQSSDIARRNPSQARARVTVDTIFEATARILERDDAARLTTNHIAERAGFSIGTLYGYFPNKQALLRALALREMKRQEAHVMTALNTAGCARSADDLVRIVVRAALRPFEGRNRLRLAMMRLLARDPDIMAAARRVQEYVMDILLREISTRGLGSTPLPCPTARFTRLAAVSGAIQTTAIERLDIFETQAFEDEIVKLVLQGVKPGF